MLAGSKFVLHGRPLRRPNRTVQGVLIHGQDYAPESEIDGA